LAVDAPSRRKDRPEKAGIFLIYRLSFTDGTGAGEGDLRGIVRGLGHVTRLRAGAIRLSRFFGSPVCIRG